jgi:hypothetical protein
MVFEPRQRVAAPGGMGGLGDGGETSAVPYDERNENHRSNRQAAGNYDGPPCDQRTDNLSISRAITFRSADQKPCDQTVAGVTIS